MMPPDNAEERIVQFRSDGLGLSPQAYARLLAQIAETRGIAEDDYSRDGVVGELGSHDELLRLGGTYARYFDLQARIFEAEQADA